jgi:hypothetical protein
MKPELTRGTLLAAALALAGLACSLPIDIPFLSGGEEQAPTPPAVESRPAEEIAPTELPTEEPAGVLESAGGPESLDLDDPAIYKEPIGFVNSYQVELSFDFNATAADGSPVSGFVQASGARTLSPDAMSMSFDGQGEQDLTADLPLKFSLIDGVFTVFSPEVNCATLPAGEFTDPFAILVDLGGFLTGQAERARPDETVNGVDTYRFALDTSNVEDTELVESGEVTSGMLYLAREGGYVVRLEMSGTGVSEMLSGDPELVGDVEYLLNYYDFNLPVTISPPEECASQAGGPPTDYPLTDDAAEVFNFGGLVSYTSQMDFEAVVQFYKDEMPAAGWTLTDEVALGSLALLSFENSDGTVQVSVSYDEGTDQVQVTILSGE